MSARDLISRALRPWLSLPGLHYFATRVLGGRIRSWSFDERYRSGRWSYATNRASELVSVLENHAANGRILMLGCGTASIAGALDPARYESILGIDISSVAIAKAREHANDRIRFEVGDMLSCRPMHTYEVVLFSESLNYVRWWQRKGLLQRLGRHLAPNGCFIVTISQPNRYARLLAMIRNNFAVLEDRPFQNSRRHLVIFRSRHSHGPDEVHGHPGETR